MTVCTPNPTLQIEKFIDLTSEKLFSSNGLSWAYLSYPFRRNRKNKRDFNHPDKTGIRRLSHFFVAVLNDLIIYKI